VNQVEHQAMSNQYPATMILGLGKTGYACARFLAARNTPFLVLDTRENPPYLSRLREQQPDQPVLLGPLDPAILQQAERLLVSPGLAVTEPAIAAAQAAGVRVSGDIDLFCEVAAAPIIAITGSNAKSTVTTLVGLMGERAGQRVVVGGNLGVPVLELLTDANQAVDAYVLELSSFQLEITSKLRADVATLLNLSPDHMDRYASFTAYRDAKRRIFHGCRQAVVNRDEPHLQGPLPTHTKVIGFGLERPPQGNDFGVLEQQGIEYLARGSQPLMPVAELKIKGRHNLANALAALAVGEAAGFALAPMLATLRTFPGLPHRCQWVREVDGVNYYNDSKGTNVGATVAALVGLGASTAGRVVLIAGGEGKGADFSALWAPVQQYCAAVIVIGRDAPQIEQAVTAHGADELPVVHAQTMREAVQRAATQANPGDLVLLSPACASFDMFGSFEARGEAYLQAVRALP